MKQALSRLRVQTEWFCSPRRIEREAIAMRCLKELAPPGTITPLLFEDSNHHLLIMRAVPEPHLNWKESLLAEQIEMKHVEQFGRLIGTIHRAGSERREDLPPALHDQTFFEQLRIDPFYRYTAARIPASGPFFDSLTSETLDCRLTLVHGDYSPKNILVYEDRLILLDHEVVHVGDPAFDLGFSLAHFLSKAHHLRKVRSVFSAAAVLFWDTYRQTVTGLEWSENMEPRIVRHAIACLLARVAGRSTLEYLKPAERKRQKTICLRMITDGTPESVEDLVSSFIAEAANYD